MLAGAILLGAEFVSGRERQQAQQLASVPPPAAAAALATAPDGPAPDQQTQSNTVPSPQPLGSDIMGAAAPGSAAAPAPAPGSSASNAAAAGPADPGPAVPPTASTAPAKVTIPAIGVNASVIPLGENPDGTVKVPSLATPRLTSWFDDGPAPGQDGPAAIYGHVATAATGPAVFYRLRNLVPGDAVDVTRASHSVAVFRVYQVSEYSKGNFPTLAVYGDTPGPELRLITCGGAFDRAKGSYAANVVVYARLTSTHGS
ncbi:MAG TPA: class F sortase [Trebonia sp.]|nr:class F sortase [Trebonia sp.]